MVEVRINDDEKAIWSDQTAKNLLARIDNLRKAGQSVKASVSISLPDKAVSITLITGAAPQIYCIVDGCRVPNEAENCLIKLWTSCNLKTDNFSTADLGGFLERVPAEYKA